MDIPVGPAVGVSWRRHRLWWLARGVLVPLVAVGSLLVPWLVQHTPLRELWGVPYPPLFTRRTMVALDYYALGMIGLGLVFLEGAVLALRASRFPRTDGAGAALLGTALCAVGGLVLFARVCAVVHG